MRVGNFGPTRPGCRRCFELLALGKALQGVSQGFPSERRNQLPCKTRRLKNEVSSTSKLRCATLHHDCRSASLGGRHLGEFGPDLNEKGPNLKLSGPIWIKFGPNGDKSRRFRPAFVEFGRCRLGPNLVKVGPMLVDPKKMLVDVYQFRPRFGGFRAKSSGDLGQLRPVSTRCFDVDWSWPEMGKSRTRAVMCTKLVPQRCVPPSTPNVQPAAWEEVTWYGPDRLR